MAESGRNLKKSTGDFDEDMRLMQELDIAKARQVQLSRQTQGRAQAARESRGQRVSGPYSPLRTILDKVGVEMTVARRSLVGVWRDLAYPLSGDAAAVETFERHQQLVGGYKDAMVELRATKNGARICEGFEFYSLDFKAADFVNYTTQSMAIGAFALPTTGRLLRIQVAPLIDLTSSPLQACIVVLQRKFTPGAGWPYIALNPQEIVYASDNTFALSTFLGPGPCPALDAIVPGPPMYQNTDDEPAIGGMTPQQSTKQPQLWVAILLNAVASALPAGLIIRVTLWANEVV